MDAVWIERHRTALFRSTLSRPMRLALSEGLVSEKTKVFDYGCGRGDDLRMLRTLGVVTAGWDPVHRPHEPIEAADVVNLGYVINVIEDPSERARVLSHAWTLAGEVLLVAGQLQSDAKPGRSVAFGDGCLTRIGTFQKYYTQTELQAWIDVVLEAESIALAPGIFAVFRSEARRELFLSARVRRYQRALPQLPRMGTFERYRELLGPLVQFLMERGRAPYEDELPETGGILSVFKSLKRAVRIITSALGATAWADVRERRSSDLTVYLALSRLRRRPLFSNLPPALQGDVRAFYGTYSKATALADRLLYAAGDNDLREIAFENAAAGKLTGNALYVHSSAVESLAPILRVVEGCARAFAGEIEGANVVKLHRHKPMVSYLSYPEFDAIAHPPLRASLIVNLQKLYLDVREYDRSENPPVLHRKEELVPSDYTHRDRFARLTQQEERRGLYSQTERIGTQKGWEAVLREAGVVVRGHRLLRSTGTVRSREEDDEGDMPSASFGELHHEPLALGAMPPSEEAIGP